MNKISLFFIIKTFAISIILVTVYAAIINCVVYFFVRKRRHSDVLISLTKKSFVKLPFVLTGYGFLAGVGVYVGIALIDALFGKSGHASISGGGSQSSDSGIGLIVFTTPMGFCISVGVGWAAFFKAYRALNPPISSDDRK